MSSCYELRGYCVYVCNVGVVVYVSFICRRRCRQVVSKEDPQT
jgi:hypothetical protein